MVRTRTDDDHMRRALFHAARGAGRTTPNPMVGAVVVSAEGVVVGVGYHEAAGLPHAEVAALDSAGSHARGATLYCTLEPCCHWGRTGPCVERIVQANVARVVAAVEDPNPRVNGAGFRYLREQGVEVATGLCRAEAIRLNAPFFTAMRFSRPFVTVKIALSLDGRIAARPGERTLLTGPEANRLIHLERAEVDAIAVGARTILVDDPLLTPRGAYRVRPLTRVVFDATLRMIPEVRVLSTLAAGPVIIVVTSAAAAAQPDRARALERAGARLLVTESRDLKPALERLIDFDVQSLLLEGGASLHRAAWKAGLVDRVEAWVTPQVLGGDGVNWLSGTEVSLASLQELRVDGCGPDVRIEGYVHGID